MNLSIKEGVRIMREAVRQSLPKWQAVERDKNVVRYCLPGGSICYNVYNK